MAPHAADISVGGARVHALPLRTSADIFWARPTGIRGRLQTVDRDGRGQKQTFPGQSMTAPKWSQETPFLTFQTRGAVADLECCGCRRNSINAQQKKLTAGKHGQLARHLTVKATADFRFLLNAIKKVLNFSLHDSIHFLTNSGSGLASLN